LHSEVVLPDDVLPDNGPENDEVIAKPQIVETAKMYGRPRWLIFSLLGVLVTAAIGAGLGIALGNSGDKSSPLSVLKKIISAEIPLLRQKLWIG
jgi:hypothetical protein